MQATQTPVAFSGDIPKYYDLYLGPMFFEPYALDMANRIAGHQPKKILEVASGTGRLTKLITGIMRESSLIASDVNPAMVAFGESSMHSEKVKWMEIDAVSLPFEDESFDAVVAQFGVMFYSDRIQAYQEALRVLKPGGVLLFNCWDSLKHNPMANLANEALVNFFPVETPAFYAVPFSYFNESEIADDLRQAGFENFSIELVSLTGSCVSAGHAAKGLILGTPTVTAIRERDAKKLLLVVEHLENEIKKLFGTEVLQVPLQARVVRAIK